MSMDDVRWLADEFIQLMLKPFGWVIILMIIVVCVLTVRGSWGERR